MYNYNLSTRPFSIGTYPNNNNFIGFKEDMTNFGYVSYEEPLTLSEILNFELKPTHETLNKLIPLSGTYCIGRLEMPYHINIGINKRYIAYMELKIKRVDGKLITQSLKFEEALKYIKEGKLMSK